MRHISTPLILAYGLIILGTQTTLALTIYRIGGADQPPPELDARFDFIQIPWAEISADRHGQTQFLEIKPDHVAPQQLDPTVNLTPILENLGGELARLGGNNWEFYRPRAGELADGDPTTAHIGGLYGWWRVFDHIDHRWVRWTSTFLFDLGGTFSVHRIRFAPRSQFRFDRPVRNFLVALGVEEPAAVELEHARLGPCPWCTNKPLVRDFDIIHRNPGNNQAVIDLQITPREVNSVLLQAFANPQGVWEIAEFEIYGSGFVARSAYSSNIIDLGAPAILGPLSWGGRQVPDTSIDLRVRRGDDDDPNTYWRATFRGAETTRFDNSGQPLDRAAYQTLASGERAGTTYDAENWSFWSAPTPFAARQAAVPGDRPRRFVQIQADFRSIPQAASQLGYIQFAVSHAPAVGRAVAEIAPVVAPAGVPTRFTYILKPTFTNVEQGFDRLTVESPGLIMGVEAVRLSGQDLDFAVVHLDSSGFAVKFPRLDVNRTDELLEVDFSARIFRFGTVFSSRLADSTRPHELAQPVEAGDADPLGQGRSLQVDLTDLDQPPIADLAATPQAFTPNGDGINDLLQITYNLVNLAGVVPVALDAYDLSGRRRAPVYQGTATSGAASTQWNGRDVQGNRLPPGLYLLQLEVHTDQRTHRRQHLISLVY
ncbi:MAG: hypothetical protein GKR89_30430 [Candidatus Latescibacteria bacterium]|nr:hypothetical protein [Candidatus Latescibacterota bacterium]